MSASLRPIQKVRKDNLLKVIKSRFEGNSSECARAIERSHTFMWQLVTGHRAIGEESARHIEAKLKLGANALDQKIERTTMLTAHDEDGSKVRNYPMVPLLALADLDAKPIDYVPCPIPGAGTKLFAVVIGDEQEVVELQRGDQVFVDQADVAPVVRKLYVVQRKGADKMAFALMARKLAKSGWVYSSTGEGTKQREEQLTAAQVRVVGRVILIMREIPK